MAHQIIVRKRFSRQLVLLLEYLEGEWGKAVADNFLKILEQRIDVLSNQPNIGLKSEISDARSILVTKHNRLYYRAKGNKIEIVALIDTRINPKNNPYK